jgi:hypothetical protein
MTFLGKFTLSAAAVVLAASASINGFGWPHAAAAPAGEEFASHRAVYELSLARSNGNSTVAARGRILYDFSGSSCEGYALRFRQVSQLDNGEGRSVLSDLRTTTWEDGAAKSYLFKSQSYINQELRDSVDGKAERQSDKVAVALSKPEEKTLELVPHVAFPTDHMRRVIVAARAGNTVLEAPVYDGSDGGAKMYETLTVIGRVIEPNERVPADAAAGQAALAGLKRWPITVSYFDKAKSGNGEQSPVYSIKFELYENGVSRALVLDYNDFAIAGELTTLEMRDSKPCP